MSLRWHGCQKTWGLVVAVDKTCGMLSVVETRDLQCEYERIREAIEKGLTVKQVLLRTYGIIP